MPSAGLDVTRTGQHLPQPEGAQSSGGFLSEVSTGLLREEHPLSQPTNKHRAGQSGNISHSICWTWLWQADANGYLRPWGVHVSQHCVGASLSRVAQPAQNRRVRTHRQMNPNPYRSENLGEKIGTKTWYVRSNPHF